MSPLHPFRTPSDPSSLSNRRFKASQVTALRCLPPPVPVRSLLAPAVQSSPPPRASTGDVDQSSSVEPGEAVGLAAAAVGEFSPSSSSSFSLHVIRNCCSPGGGFSLLMKRILQRSSHMTITLLEGESWGRYLSGWRLVSPARDKRRRIPKEGGWVTRLAMQGT